MTKTDNMDLSTYIPQLYSTSVRNPIIDIILLFTMLVLSWFVDVTHWAITHDGYLSLGLKVIAYTGIIYRVFDIIRRKSRRKKLAIRFTEAALGEIENLRHEKKTLTQKVMELEVKNESPRLNDRGSIEAK